MKLKRYKKVRKLLHYYELNHSYKPPYNLVCDAEFLQAAKEGKIMLKEQLPKFLQEENTHLYVTKCIIQHIREQGKSFGAALFIANTLELLPCSHDNNKKHVKQYDCIKSLLSNNNENKYLVAAQTLDLRSYARSERNIPILFIRGSVPIMEPPNHYNKSLTLSQQTQQKAAANAEEKAAVEAAIQETSGPIAAIKPRRKKAKGPNPLSIKKKQKQHTNNNSHDSHTNSNEMKPSEKKEREKNKQKQSQGNDEKQQLEADSSTATPSALSSAVLNKLKRKRHRSRKNKSEDSAAAATTQAKKAKSSSADEKLSTASTAAVMSDSD
jgi:U3 small nucleolar RNA-associated protein 23